MIDNFLSLQDIGVFAIFIIIVTAVVQMLKKPVDACSQKIFKRKIKTNYITFFVAYVLYFIFKILNGVNIDGELFFVVFANAVLIGFGSSGIFNTISEKK